MHLTTSTTGLLLGLMSVWSCTAAPAELTGLAVPTTCTRKTACYTYTAYTTPAACPKLDSCPDLPGVMCPMYISIATSRVPCSNACCPKTGTQTVATTCRTCPTGCVIPTQTVTMTTGCKVTTTPTFTATPEGPSVTLIPGGGGASVTLKPGRM